MEDNKWLLKQTYEYKWYFNTVMALFTVLLLVFTPMFIFAMRSGAFDHTGIIYMIIVIVFFLISIVFSFFKLKKILNYPETYTRYDAKVIKLGHFGKRWFLTLRIIKEDGTVFEMNTEKVFSYFGAKLKLEKTVSVLYDAVDGRLAVIKTDI